MSEVSSYEVRPLGYAAGREFIEKNHYARGCSNAATGTFGLWRCGVLIGVCMFATPCSEDVRASVFGPDHKDRVTELHRLVVLDVTPRNAESFFIAESLRQLKDRKPHLWAVVSFADSTVGHVGTIYQASNGYYYGTSPGRRFWVDGDGRLRHPRQCGKHIDAAAAAARGWVPVRRGPKHRYCLFVPDDRRHGRLMQGMLRLPHVTPYPKVGINNGAPISPGRPAVWSPPVPAQCVLGL